MSFFIAKQLAARWRPELRLGCYALTHGQVRKFAVLAVARLAQKTQHAIAGLCGRDRVFAQKFLICCVHGFSFIASVVSVMDLVTVCAK